MRRSIGGALLVAAVLTGSQVTHSAAALPNFSGDWVLVDGTLIQDRRVFSGAGSDFSNPFGQQEGIQQGVDRVTFTAGNRVTAYGIGADKQAQWLNSAMLITVRDQRQVSDVDAIFLLTPSGPNEIKLLQSVPAVFPRGSMSTVIATYRRK